MDSKGFIFTFDAVLALIPILILFTAVINMGNNDLTASSGEIRISQDAQDSLEMMAHYKNSADGVTILQKITNTLEINNNNPAGIATASIIAGEFLNKTLGGLKYNLTEVNQLNGVTIASNANIEEAGNVAVGVKSYGNYTFKLYVWN